MNYLTLEDVVDQLPGRAVFCRADVNTTLINGGFQENERVVRTGETIKFLTDHGARVVVGTHNGRRGNADFVSVGPLVPLFQARSVPMTTIGNTYREDALNSEAVKAIQSLADGQSLLLENLRFLPGEKGSLTPEEYARSPFVRTLIDDCGVALMVSDGFSVAHRQCRSLLGFLEIPNVAGLTMQQELSSLDEIYVHFNDTASNNVYVLGGKKIQDYFALMRNSLENGVVDHILTGGLLAHLILHVQGVDIGDQSRALLERDDGNGSLLKYADEMRSLLDQYQSFFEVPDDVAYDVDGKRAETSIDEIDALNDKGPILDIGHKTVDRYRRILRGADFIYMKGPVGKFEDSTFAYSSRRLLDLMTGETNYSVIGGGDTSVMLTHFDVLPAEINFVSLAGGALLLALAGETLPGVQALESSYHRFRDVNGPAGI